MTLEEIAKEIGVSKSTVSRALSGKGRIGEKTRNRILEVAKRGEEREEMARTRTVTHNIGVVLPQTFIMEAVFIPELSARRLRIGIDARVQCADYDEQRA